MDMTWKELQEDCLRKMFSLDGTELVRDSSTNPYLNSMPAAANEAMRILATTGRYWKKCTTITQGGESPTPAPLTLGGYYGYDLKALTGDFYCIQGIKLASGSDYGDYDGYRMEGNELLLLPKETEGDFRIWYNAYPPKITKETADDFKIELPPEEASMIALYMAGQLYKDDDISIAQIYMNEFATWLEELKTSAAAADGRNTGGGEWKSIKGYY